MRQLSGAATALLLLAAAHDARAEASIVAPSSGGQGALAVQITAAGITARACAAAASCAAAGGAALAVPDDVMPLLAGGAARVVTLAGKKSVVRVDVPGGSPGASWVLLAAAPIGAAGDPVVIWSGWTGRSTGEYGEGKSTVVLEEPIGAETRVVIGQRRDDVTICGRPTIVAAREVSPATMQLARGASVQNLPAAERAAATRLFARRSEQPAAAPRLPLLRATAASSAVDRRFATVSDGDAATWWSEAKAGSGAGELVAFSSASEVAITSLDLVVRPGGDVPAGAAPRSFYVATPDRLFAVTMPEDAWKHAGQTYAVDLPEPLRTSCLAVVLDEAYASGKDAQVTLAEITARTAFDGMGLDALAGALAGGGERAAAAAALLARGGPAAAKAAVAAYPRLDDEGRGLALDVIETGPCSEQVPFFASLFAARADADRASPVDRDLEGSADRELSRARDRLRRCGRASSAELGRLVAEAAPPVKIAAARELVLVAPEDAVATLLDALPAADTRTRAALREALAHAAKRERAFPAFAAQLAPDAWLARPEIARVDLLRALGATLGSIEGGPAAFADLARGGASFRTRYLLLGPAAQLARGGDAGAEAFLLRSLRDDPDRHVRARAAEVAAAAPGLAAELVLRIDDAEPRVRQAAIASFVNDRAAAARTPAAEKALVSRLATDPWTYVRSGSALALAAFPASPAADRALAAALADPSIEVRSHAVDGLGAHRATAYAGVLRERAADKGEALDVRTRAILALAAMCDAASIDDWTKLAHTAAAPFFEQDRRLGAAAITALGLVHPADLAARFAPLAGPQVSPGVADAARAALASPPGCSAPPR